jgi:hypothetical protein
VQLFHFDSTTGARNECNPLAVTQYSDFLLTGPGSYFGDQGATFDGDLDAVSQYLGDSIAFGAEDFTIDFWFNMDDPTGNNVAVMTGTPGSSRWYAQVNQNRVRWVLEDFGFPVFTLQSASTIGSTTWHHYAVTRSGSDFTLYVDGQVEATGSYAPALPPSDGQLWIGTDQHPPYGGGSGFYGDLDELRIAKGYALFDGPFAVPTRRSACEPTPGCGVTMDGVDGEVTVPDNAAYNLGAGAFTIEAWASLDAPLGLGEQATIVGHSAGVGEQDKWVFNLEAVVGAEDDMDLAFHVNSPSAPVGGEFPVRALVNLPAGRFHHFALVRDGVDLRLYVNGKLVQATTWAGSIGDPAAPLTIGRVESMGPFPGAVADVHLSDVARYSADFVPPMTSGADSNTLGLWRLDETSGAAAVDASLTANDGAHAGGVAAGCLP